MRIASRISALTKIAILATTLVLTSLALIIGRDTGPEPVSLSVGEPAPQTFIASGPVEVVDVNETERQRADAAAAVMDALGIEKAHIVGASQGGQSPPSWLQWRSRV